MDLQEVVSVLKSYSHLFIDAYVFGSVANGSQDEYSDVDIVIIRETDLPFFDRIREIMELRRSFMSADLLIYTPAEIQTMRNEPGRYFIKNAVKDGYHVEGKQQRSGSMVSTG